MEKEIIERENIVGAAIFEGKINYARILQENFYIPRQPEFGEIIKLATIADGQNYRSQLSARVYNFWRNQAQVYAFISEQEKTDALTFLLSIAQQEKIRNLLRSVANELSPATLQSTVRKLMDNIPQVLSLQHQGIVYDTGLQDYIEKYLRELVEGKKQAIMTGLSALDNTGVFLPRREYSVFSGRTGSGKTTVACMLVSRLLIAHEIAPAEYRPRLPLFIFFVSTEMPIAAIFGKILCSHLHEFVLENSQQQALWGLSQEDIHLARTLKWKDFCISVSEDRFEFVQRIAKKFVELYGWRLALFHTSIPSMHDIIAVGERIAAIWQGVFAKYFPSVDINDNMDVFILDYIQNIRTASEVGETSSYGRRASLSISREIGLAAQMFKDFCIRHNTAGILLSQVNHEGEIRDSRVIEHAAALHVRVGWQTRDISRWIEGLLRRQKGISNKEEKANMLQEMLAARQTTPLDFSILKNRYGAKPIFPIIIEWMPAIPRVAAAGGISEIEYFRALLQESGVKEEEERQQLESQWEEGKNEIGIQGDFPF